MLNPTFCEAKKKFSFPATFYSSCVAEKKLMKIPRKTAAPNISHGIHFSILQVARTAEQSSIFQLQPYAGNIP